MYRRNSDSNLRDLERLAAKGDIEAEKKLYRARWRSGMCHLHPGESLFGCPICFAPVERSYSEPNRAYQENVVVDLLLRDLGPDATIFEIGQWVKDRSNPHRHDPNWTIFSIFNPVDPRLCKRPLGATDYRGMPVTANASLDTIDCGALIYESGRFNDANRLDDWHQLVRVIESPRPLDLALERPSPEAAVAYFTATLEQVLGPVDWQLEAVHAPSPADTRFLIYANSEFITNAETDELIQIGSVSYSIQTREFAAANMSFSFYNGQIQ